MKALSSLLVLLLAGACQVVDRAAPGSDAPSAAAGTLSRSPAEDLVAYLAGLRSLSDSGLAAEAARQKQLAARGSDDLARLKAALALSLAPQSDESEILTLVDPLARKESAPRDVRVMASFLQVVANERRRLKESAAAAKISLRDERRALEAQKQRADALQERAAQLQQKLDALTELEKSLSDRPPPSR